jgi:hypothetical protein
MVQKRKTKVAKKVLHKKRSSHPGYHAESVAMFYRLSGAGIVILGGMGIIFVLKAALNLA